ncbi:MAG: undecaprenyl-diphosphate phosphatase [Clostridia bacterium]|nr:undecaprenyl-diphosphate phosphatase [Clostridia bacterium]
MSIWDSIIQGFVQGATEFLPVSSSGHLSIVQHFLGGGEENSMMFSLLLHLGTLIAVFIAYRKLIGELIVEFCKMIGDIFKGKFSFKTINTKQLMALMVILSIIPTFLLMIPVGGGMKAKDLIAKVSEDKDIIIEGICFLITGIILIVATAIDKKRAADGIERRTRVGVKDALVMGSAQALAAMPGISRSGSTTTTGMLCGLEKNTALAFSFIMGIPAILGANILEFGDAMEQGVNFGVVEAVFGIVVSAVVGIIAIKLLKWVVNNNKLNYFGWYCIILSAAVIGIGIYEHISGKVLSF